MTLLYLISLVSRICPSRFRLCSFPLSRWTTTQPQILIELPLLHRLSTGRCKQHAPFWLYDWSSSPCSLFTQVDKLLDEMFHLQYLSSSNFIAFLLSCLGSDIARRLGKRVSVTSTRMERVADTCVAMAASTSRSAPMPHTFLSLFPSKSWTPYFTYDLPFISFCSHTGRMHEPSMRFGKFNREKMALYF
jgi:hypothetical protein